GWIGQQPELGTVVHRYCVSTSLAEVLLPLMCATGRCVILGEDAEKGRPLTWDEGSPWELCVEVARDEEEDKWRLDGRLRREGEALALRDATLVLPGGLLFLRDSVARFQDFGAPGWVELLRSEGPICVPAEEGHELVDRLLDMPQLPRLELPPELRLAEVSASPVPHLTLHTPRGIRRQHQRLPPGLSFEYQ